MTQENTMKNEQTVINKLFKIQQELKAPKSLRNDFSGFNYRSAEKILEEVKPLLEKYKCVLTLTDEILNIGDRYYVKAIAVLEDFESQSATETFALAREQESKKGMDEAQITGAASSYARKYALNGLFAIDDTKDPDMMDNRQNGTRQHKKVKPDQRMNQYTTREQEMIKAKKELYDAFTDKGITKVADMNQFFVKVLGKEEVTDTAEAKQVLTALKEG